MKKLFTLFAMVLMATTMSAQEPIWTATGAFSYYPEDWNYDNTNVILVGKKGVLAESYEDYTLIHGWCGVEGFDLAFGHGDTTDGYTYPSSICTVKGDEWSDEKIVNIDKYDYFVVETGMEDYPYARIMKKYSYLCVTLANPLEDEEFSANLTLNMQLGTDADFTRTKDAEIHLVWPEEDAVTRLPEDDAILLYTGSGTATFKDVTVENVNVEVYDMLVLIKAFAGVEGYDLKLFYDETGAISKVSPENPQTGRDDAYNSFYIYAAPDYPTYSTLTLRENGGKASLTIYVNKSYDKYVINWEKKEDASISSTTVNQAVNRATFNLAGQKVSSDFKGIAIKNGKKIIQ